MSEQPHPAGIDVAGTWYLRDAKGNLVPIGAVKPGDLLIDEAVREMAAAAQPPAMAEKWLEAVDEDGKLTFYNTQLALTYKKNMGRALTGDALLERREQWAAEVPDGVAALNLAEPGYDAVIAGGTRALSGATSFGGVVRNVFSPGAAKVDKGGAAVERGGRAIERASNNFVRAAPGLTPGAVAAARRASAGRPWLRPSTQLGQYGLESSFGRRMPAGSNNPFGIKARKGEPYVLARTREEDRFGRSYYTMARFRKFNSLDESFEAHAKLLEGRRYKRFRAAGSSRDASHALTGTYATDQEYGSKLNGMIRQHGLERFDRDQMKPIPVKVEVEMRGAPPGTRTRVTAGRASSPAVSHAYEPIRGG